MCFAAVLDHATEAFQEQLTLIFNQQDDIAATLHRFARQFLQKVTSPEALALYRLVVAEANRFPETGRIFYEGAMGRTRAALAGYLAEVTAHGQLRAEDPQLAAQQLIALCMSGCHQLLMVRLIEEPEPERIEIDVGDAVTTFMRAFAL